MTLGDFTPIAVTEWNEAVIADCGWSSTLMAANKASLGAYPSTRAEREAIASAAGHVGGGASTVEDNDHGLQARYHWSGTVYRGALAGFLSAMTPGMGAVLQGYYSALPAHFQRWDPAFAAKGAKSLHAVYVQRMPDTTFWWIDPLFHGEPAYRGEAIPLPALAAFATAYKLPVAALIVVEGSHVPSGSGPDQPEEPVSTFSPKPGLFAVKANAPYYDAPDLTRTPIGRFPVANDHVEVLGAITGWRVGIVAANPGTLAVWIPADQGADVPLPKVDTISRKAAIAALEDL